MMNNLPRPAQAARFVAGLLLCSACAAREPEAPHPVVVEGELHEGRDLSAIARVRSFWVVASDEGRALQILDGAAEPSTLRVRRLPIPLLEGETEIDLEDLAATQETLFALGSHSLKRLKLDAGGRAENRRRIERVVDEPTRHHLFRLVLDDSGTLSSRGSINLRSVLANDPVLARFLAIPGKENGLDLEGLALLDGKLFVGCRSPVLRGGFVPVIVLDFDRPQNYELRFVDLGGDGIRALARAESSLVMVSGDPRGLERPQGIWLWNGRDMLPGEGGAGGNVRRLATLDASPAPVEGLAVLRVDEAALELLTARDGAVGGGFERRRLPLR